MVKNLSLLLMFCTVSLSAQYVHQSAKKQYELGVYDLALSSYLSAEKSGKLTADEMAIMADIYRKSGNVDQALQYYAKAEGMGSAQNSFQIAYAKTLVGVGNYALALEKLSGMPDSEEISHLKAQIEYAKAASKSPSKSQEINQFIGSSSAEFALTVVDGQFVFNTYNKLKMSPRSSKAVEGQIGFALATMENGTETPFIEGLANRLNIGAISFSENGKCVYTRSVPLCEYEACRNIGASLYIADFQKGNISNERGLNINKLGVANFDPSISADGKTIVFASDREGGIGGTDLYEIKWNGKEWSEPINLGNEVNTPGNEKSPHLNNNELYFASDYHLGLGGFDLFEALKINGAYGQIKQVNGVNSSMDETYPFINKATGDLYFTSNRNAIEKENIYFTSLNEQPLALATEQPSAFVLPAFNNPKVSVSSGTYDGARRVSIGTVITKSLTNVYYIQLAAFNKKNANDFEKFRDLVKFGNIYKFDIGQAVKVRLGYFVDEVEARSVLTKIKLKGYPDAFVVSNPLNTSDMELVLSTYDVNRANVQPSEPKTDIKKPEAPRVTNDIHDSNISYKIRLASYEDPIWFDLKKVNDLGHIEQWSKGTWTIFVISGFKSFQDAEQARVKAVNRGFTSAEVVIDNGGVIESIKKN